MSRRFSVVPTDGPAVELDFEEAAVAEVRKMIAAGSQVILIVGEIGGDVTVVSLPNSGAMEFGLMTIALHSYTEEKNDSQ